VRIRAGAADPWSRRAHDRAGEPERERPVLGEVRIGRHVVTTYGSPCDAGSKKNTSRRPWAPGAASLVFGLFLWISPLRGPGSEPVHLRQKRLILLYSEHSCVF